MHWLEFLDIWHYKNKNGACLLALTSQFHNYCPLVWIIHSKKLNKKINKLHERALRIVYGDHKTKFSELLNIDKSVTIHQRNLQYLLIEIYKVKKGISPTIMNEIFQFFENPVHERRIDVHLPSRNSRTVFFSTESIMNPGANLWNMVPQDIKSSESLNVFKSKIKYWTSIIVHAEFAKPTLAELVL